MSQPPKRRPPARQGQGQQKPQSQRRSNDYYQDYPPPPPRGRYNDAPRRGGPYYQQRPRAVYPQRDPFPYIMGGLIGAMVVGLMLVVFLIISNNNNKGTPTVQNPGTVPGATVPANEQATGDPPPRMDIDEFKKLYDDPARRPMIIDVRPTQAFEEGHIAGAVSIPETEVDVVLAKIPRDKLVVAYCQ